MSDNESGIRWDRVRTFGLVAAGVIAIAVLIGWAVPEVPTWQTPEWARDVPDFGPLLTLLALYFIPSIVAIAARHRQVPAIVALNLLLGWTVLGWIGALIWALVRGPAGATVED